MNTFRTIDQSSDPSEAEARAFREVMVSEMRERGDLRSRAVESAFLTVPRHRFAPEATLEQAYRSDDVVATKWDDHGLVVSSVSAPRIQAMMLEQAQLRPGMRVLEVGSGGYNAALIAELVGDTGEVTTVDIDQDVVDRARTFLKETGYQRVTVVLADAEHGVAEHAPYDRIIVTAGAWDIPPAWRAQLAQDGRLVVPLRMRGLTRSVALERAGDRLVSTGYGLCGFVEIQGEGAKRERLVLLHDEDVALRVDGMFALDQSLLRDALHGAPVERGSGVEVGGFEPFDELDLWTATAADEFALLAAKAGAIESGLVAGSARMGAKTLLGSDSFAYRASRPTSTQRTSFEFVAYGHGPQGERLADEHVELIRTWDRVHRNGPGARIEVFPADTADDQLPAGRVIEKTHTRVVIVWPETTS